jgi:hypothetical protein
MPRCNTYRSRMTGARSGSIPQAVTLRPRERQRGCAARWQDLELQVSVEWDLNCAGLRGEQLKTNNIRGVDNDNDT